jgi:DNA-binding CsgD family transcriptional regulator
MNAAGLFAADRAENATLQQSIADALAGCCAASATGAVRISRPSMRRPLSLIVAPFKAKAGWFQAPPSGAIVLVRDPEHAAPVPEDWLRQLFGLTLAEAALTTHIARGHGLKAAAERLGIARSTANTHLQRVFEKTQTRRQAELVRLINSMELSVTCESARGRSSN